MAPRRSRCALRARRELEIGSKRLVQALVVKRAAHGGEPLAEFPGVLRGDVSVVGLVILPDLDHRKMIRPAHLLQHLEAHYARLLSAVADQGLESGYAVIL